MGRRSYRGTSAPQNFWSGGWQVCPDCQNCVRHATLLQQINHVGSRIIPRPFSATRLREIQHNAKLPGITGCFLVETCDMSMGAKANLNSKFPSRYLNGRSGRAPYRSGYFAGGQTIEQTQRPCIADLKLPGRYMAKYLFEAGGVPLLVRQTGTMLKGAVTHRGGSAETTTYADI
jgi:hypothetical protein